LEKLLRARSSLTSPLNTIIISFILLFTLAHLISRFPGAWTLVLGWVALIGMASSIFLTVVAGIAVTVAHPPLRPLAEHSIFFSRLMLFVKVASALAALLFTTLFAWAMGSDLDRTSLAPNAVMDTVQTYGKILLSLLMAFAIFYWMTLAVDLLRLKRAGRERGIELLLAKMSNSRAAEWPEESRGVRRLREKGVRIDLARIMVRRLLQTVLNSPLWIIASFYMMPLTVGVFILHLRSTN